MSFHTLLHCLNSILFLFFGFWFSGFLVGEGTGGRGFPKEPPTRNLTFLYGQCPSNIVSTFLHILFQSRSNFITKKKKKRKKKYLYESNMKPSVCFLYLHFSTPSKKCYYWAWPIYLVRLTFAMLQNRIHHQTLVSFLMGPIWHRQQSSKWSEMSVDTKQRVYLKGMHFNLYMYFYFLSCIFIVMSPIFRKLESSAKRQSAIVR